MRPGRVLQAPVQLAREVDVPDAWSPDTTGAEAMLARRLARAGIETRALGLQPYLTDHVWVPCPAWETWDQLKRGPPVPPSR